MPRNPPPRPQSPGWESIRPDRLAYLEQAASSLADYQDHLKQIRVIVDELDRLYQPPSMGTMPRGRATRIAELRWALEIATKQLLRRAGLRGAETVFLPPGPDGGGE